jgi:acetyl esterase
MARGPTDACTGAGWETRSVASADEKNSPMSAPDEPLVIEPGTEVWLDALAATPAGRRPPYELSLQDARQVLRSIQASVEVDQPAAEIIDHLIVGGPTGEVDIRIVRPVGTQTPLPIVLHCHGGGWVVGDKDTHERLVRELANAARAVVVFVNFTLAPDAQYPVQNEQAYAALEWVAANADEVGGDASRIAVLGESAGGNMAAALTLMAKERHGPTIGAQVLFYPVTGADFGTGSYRRYADGPWLTRSTMEWFWDCYLPDEEKRSDITAAPVNASTAALRNLPPALVITAEHDVLRDEGEAYARKLARADIPVTQVRYGGTIHDFVLLNPIASAPAARAAIAQAAEFIRGTLQRSAHVDG